MCADHSTGDPSGVRGVRARPQLSTGDPSGARGERAVSFISQLQFEVQSSAFRLLHLFRDNLEFSL
jgi:hypothetical protein